MANKLKQMASEVKRNTHGFVSLFQARPWIEPALLAALATLLFWKGILPAWRILNTDFPNYYLVARLLREGYSLDRIYDWVWLQRVKDHWGLDQSLVGFAGLTPFSALPVVPLSVFVALTAKRVWTVINLAFLAASAELLHRSTALGRRRIWLLSLLAILPLRTIFLYGQMHLFVLFLMTLAYYFHRRDRDFACGVCVALAGALKVYPVAFILYFLWKRQWHAVFATAGAAILIVIVGCVWMGPELLYTYATQALPRSLQGEVLDPYNLHAASGAALFHRLFLYEPALNPAPVIDSPALYAILYPLWQLVILVPLFAVLRASPSEPEREQMEWAAFLLALLILSPVPSSYHFVVLILSITLFVDALLRQGRWKAALAATVLYFFVSVADGTLLAFSRLWFGLALFVLFVVYLYRYPSGAVRRATLRPMALAVSALLALIMSFAGYRHHFFHRQQEMAHRIAAPSTTYLATLPRPGSRGYFFVGMLADGYRVLDQDGTQAAPQANAQKWADQVSFAVAPDNALYLEVDDSTGSRILRASDRSDRSVVAEDAEFPAISADGKALAFVREKKGRGGLWMTRLDDSREAIPARITGEDYDVRSASFLGSGALLFLAKHDGREGLFAVVPGAQPVPFFSANRKIESFAVAPDAHRIVFTELTHNRWQLAVLDTLTHRTSELTFGDCNAYTPAWLSSTAILYATDCGRGIGLTALASIDTVSTVPTHAEP